MKRSRLRICTGIDMPLWIKMFFELYREGREKMAVMGRAVGG
jgi:hypothetical protein